MERFFISIGNSFRNYLNFSGVATRYDFWSWIILHSIIGFLLTEVTLQTNITKSLEPSFGMTSLGSYLWQFYIAIITIPTWALITRRVRATGHNPLWVIVWVLLPPILVTFVHLSFGGPESLMSIYPTWFIFLLNDPPLIDNFWSRLETLIDVVFVDYNKDYVEHYVWAASNNLILIWLIFWESTYVSKPDKLEVSEEHNGGFSGKLRKG